MRVSNQLKDDAPSEIDQHENSQCHHTSILCSLACQVWAQVFQTASQEAPMEPHIRLLPTFSNHCYFEKHQLEAAVELVVDHRPQLLLLVDPCL